MSELPAAIARRVQAAVRDAVSAFRTQAQAGPVTEKASLRHFANPVGQEEDPLLLPRCLVLPRALTVCPVYIGPCVLALDARVPFGVLHMARRAAQC